MLYWGLKAVLWPLFRVVFRWRIEGREHLPHSGPAVLAPNHQSFCDSLFLPLAVRRRVTFLAKAEYFDARRTAWFFRAVGQIPIHRTGGDASERALAAAREVLDRGELVVIYPEGTRSTDGAVHRGRTGVARLAMQCGVPVIPVGISGTDRIQPRGSRWLRPLRPVRMCFGPPMVLADDEGGPGAQERIRSFTDALMVEIAQLAQCRYVDEPLVPVGYEVDLGPAP